MSGKAQSDADGAVSRAGERLVLGTAGHIDHGKTALVGALTGTQTDRLPEEKARGITIDLGFAALDLPGVGRFSVVDVPGHEGLVRTMVSGATGIDILLLVVAADEGVMPQTREHVAICNLLGIERGVVALTKIDIADPDLVELSGEEVRELLAPTALADAPIVPVSSQTGAGLEDLERALREAVEKAHARTTRLGPPRLNVDRVFAMKGFGTVVTGTLVGAALESGAAVEILPSGRRCRVRGLQSHGVVADRIEPGARCAVNLQGVDVSEVSRGETVTLPDAIRPTRTADVKLDWLATSPAAEGVTSVEFLAGTSERRARLAPIGTQGFTPGEGAFARLHIDGEPVTLLPGDRFIVRGFARSEGSGATLGGGAVLDIAPPHRRRSDPALARELRVLEHGGVEEAVRERVRRAGFEGVDTRELARELGIESGPLRALLDDLAARGEIQSAGANHFVDAQFLEKMEQTLVSALEAFHRAEPLRPGMPRAALRGRLPENVRPEVSERVLERLAERGELLREGDVVRRPEHSPTLDSQDEALVSRIVSEARDAGLEPPNPRDWAAALGLELDRFRDLVAHLERQGELIRAPGDLWFDRRAIETLEARILEHFQAQDELDTQTYKALIGTTRRTAMPLMELFDERRVTRRQGEVRVLRSGG